MSKTQAIVQPIVTVLNITVITENTQLARDRGHFNSNLAVKSNADKGFLVSSACGSTVMSVYYMF